MFKIYDIRKNKNMEEPFFEEILNAKETNFTIMILFITLIISIIGTIFINEIYTKYKEVDELSSLKDLFKRS